MPSITSRSRSGEPFWWYIRDDLWDRNEISVLVSQFQILVPILFSVFYILEEEIYEDAEEEEFEYSSNNQGNDDVSSFIMASGKLKNEINKIN